MNKLFVYGLLQKNFVLGLEKYGCTFLGKDQVNGRLYLIGGQGVGLRLDEHPVPTDIRAKGEVWEIPDELWDWLNEIEGVDIGTYTLRKIRTLNGVECVTYEHTSWDKNPTRYGSYVPVITDGVFQGAKSNVAENRSGPKP